jgi:hypothetical protein
MDDEIGKVRASPAVYPQSWWWVIGAAVLGVIPRMVFGAVLSSMRSASDPRRTFGGRRMGPPEQLPSLPGQMNEYGIATINR